MCLRLACWLPCRSGVGALVGPETRVYSISKSRWRVGRIKDFDPIHHPFIEYNVRFPTSDAADPAENHLRVRVSEPHADPSEVLARGGGESQYLHERRWAALAGALGLLAAVEGLTSAQGRLADDLSERAGGGACL